MFSSTYQRALAKSDVARHKLEYTRCVLEKTKHDLSGTIEQLKESTQIGYTIAMESFKEEAKKNKLGK